MSTHLPIIQDSFGRVHDYLRLSLTDRCNMRCVYCMPAEGIALRPKSEFMTTREVIGIAAEFVHLGVKKIRLTGGEPLIRRDIREIIQGLSLLPVELCITTNGLLLEQFLQDLVDASVECVNISLDSLSESTMNALTRGSHFKKVMHAIDALLERSFRVKLNAVILRGINDEELIDFIEFTRLRNVDYRFIEYMPFSGNNWNASKGVSFEELMETIRMQYGSKVVSCGEKEHDTCKRYKIEGYKGYFSFITSVSNPFCDSCNRIRLTADGRIKNCLFSNSETDLLSAYRNGEPISKLIVQSVLTKKAVRNGMDDIEKLTHSNHTLNNRSMVAIGG